MIFVPDKQRRVSSIDALALNMNSKIDRIYIISRVARVSVNSINHVAFERFLKILFLEIASITFFVKKTDVESAAPIPSVSPCPSASPRLAASRLASLRLAHFVLSSVR